MEKTAIIKKLNKWRGRKIYRTEPTSAGNEEWCNVKLFFIKASEKGILCIWAEPAIGRIGWPVLMEAEWLDDEWQLAKDTEPLGIPLMD